MGMEFLNDVNTTNGTWKLEDPYYYVRLDSMDHSLNGTQYQEFTSWDVNGAVSTAAVDPHQYYFQWTGPKSGAVTFTNTVTLPETGKYLIEIMLTGKQTSNDFYDLKIDGTSVWTQDAYQPWNDYGRIERLPIMDLTAGNRAFSLYVPASARVGWIRIIKIDRYEGGKEYNGASDTRLDLIGCGFTQNGINEIDTMELVIAMKPEYFDFNGYNIIKFDLLDHITLALGEDLDETVPMFGGYIGGWALNDDSTELTLTCVSRIWDLKRTHVMKNFFIGTAKTADDNATMPYTSFRTVQQAAAYLCTALYAIDYSAINKDYTLYNTFSTAAEVGNLTSSGFDTIWETGFGNTGCCMTLIPTRPGNNSVTLYSDPTGTAWNAAIYNSFGFDYYASGAGVKYPVKFNIEIDMYRAEEDPTSYRTYVLKFTGPNPTGTKILLKNIQAAYDGKWHDCDLDLKAEFDNVAGSNSYNIMEIRIVGSQDNIEVLNRRESGISVDNFIGYRKFDKSINKKTTDTPSAWDEMQDVMNSADYTTFIAPGMQRSEDKLIIKPKYFQVLPIALTPDNIRSVNSMVFNPMGGDVLNHARGVFRYNDKRTGTMSQFNKDHIAQYGPISQTVMLSGLSTIDAANAAAQKRVNTFTYTAKEERDIDNQLEYLLLQNVGSSQHNFLEFDVTVNGTTLMEPGQWIGVYYPQKRINGLFIVESIEHSLNFISGTFETKLGLNRPSATFMNYMRTIKALQKRMDGIESVGAFNSSGALTGGMETAKGAFS